MSNVQVLQVFSGEGDKLLTRIVLERKGYVSITPDQLLARSADQMPQTPVKINHDGDSFHVRVTPDVAASIGNIQAKDGQSHRFHASLVGVKRDKTTKARKVVVSLTPV